MALRSKATLEAFIDKITKNKDIMDYMKLPTISKKDTEAIKNKKRKAIIDKVIVTTAQNPYELNKKFTPIEIDGITYKDYGDVRMAISLAQSIKTRGYLFGNPQVDIDIYYDNTKKSDVFELLDLISDEFSGKDLEIITKEGKSYLKEIKCEGITAQVAIINNFERVGIRFSFYATLYKI